MEASLYRAKVITDILICSTCLHIISAGVNTLARTSLALLVKRTILQPVALCLTTDQWVTL